MHTTSRRAFLLTAVRISGSSLVLLAACAPAPAAPTALPATAPPAAKPTTAPAVAPTTAPAAPATTAPAPATAAPAVTTAATAVPKPAAAAANIKPGGTLKAALTGNPDKLDPATLSVY